jgi:hypothetical protein
MRETITFEKRFKTISIVTIVLATTTTALMITDRDAMVADYLNADF